MQVVYYYYSEEPLGREELAMAPDRSVTTADCPEVHVEGSYMCIYTTIKLLGSRNSNKFPQTVDHRTFVVV